MSREGTDKLSLTLLGLSIYDYPSEHCQIHRVAVLGESELGNTASKK
jgi:hypothetical protein